MVSFKLQCFRPAWECHVWPGASNTQSRALRFKANVIRSELKYGLLATIVLAIPLSSVWATSMTMTANGRKAANVARPVTPVPTVGAHISLFQVLVSVAAGHAYPQLCPQCVCDASVLWHNLYAYLLILHTHSRKRRTHGQIHYTNSWLN